jgi:2,5-furandicarboxylate decarboxylase 1
LANSLIGTDSKALRDFLEQLHQTRSITNVERELSTDSQIASVLFTFQDRSFLFSKIKECGIRLAGNLYPTQSRMKEALGISESESLAGVVSKSIENPLSGKGHVSGFDKSRWKHNTDADMTKLPILKHYEKDAGNYITAGIVAAKFPGTDFENLSFHRMLVLSKNKLAARIVPRHLDQIAKDMGGRKVPISIVIGPPPAVFLAASLQTSYGLSEYRIANSLMNGKLDLNGSELTDISVPVDSEIVLEGYLDYREMTKEGPFVDLTGTYDGVREQPVIIVERMHYNSDSVYQAVLAASMEHALFMGLPQELKIRNALSKSIPKVCGVNLTPASSGYFHCVVSIEKSNDGDGKTAILNCFAASHPLKLVIVVDGDVDPFDLAEVEWALTTRFQSDRGIVQVQGARGSSLDPSSGKTGVTSKLGIDATLPIKEDKTKFEKARIRQSTISSEVIESLRTDS